MQNLVPIGDLHGLSRFSKSSRKTTPDERMNSEGRCIMATIGEPLPQTASSFRHDAETGEHDDGLSAFASVRLGLFGIAYRMLGSSAEAEDIVQDVWLRWQSTNRSVVQ